MIFYEKIQSKRPASLRSGKLEKKRLLALIFSFLLIISAFRMRSLFLFVVLRDLVVRSSPLVIRGGYQWAIPVISWRGIDVFQFSTIAHLIRAGCCSNTQYNRDIRAHTQSLKETRTFLPLLVLFQGAETERRKGGGGRFSFPWHASPFKGSMRSPEVPHQSAQAFPVWQPGRN